jgi:hypothetical protein
MRLRLYFTLLSAACVFAGDGQYLNSRLTHSQRRITTILVLPAQTTVTRFGFKGSEGLWNENDRFEDELTAIVGKELSIRSARVSATPLDQLGAEDQLKLSEIQRIYDSNEAQILGSPGRVKKGRYTLGDEVATYGPASSFETIVFVRGRGKLNSFKGGQFTGRLTLVDARSGEVLAFSQFMCDSHKWGRSTKELESHIRESLVELTPFL